MRTGVVAQCCYPFFFIQKIFLSFIDKRFLLPKYSYTFDLLKQRKRHSLKIKIMNINSLEFKVAQELTIFEFCAICQGKGMTIEETKKEMIANADAIAQRIKEILA